MTDPRLALARFDGIARTRELRGEGCDPRALAAAVRRGEIRRVRIGWYASVNLPSSVTESLRVGGRAACVTAARIRGLWVLDEDPPLHVEVAAHDSRFRPPGDATRRAVTAELRPIRLHWGRWSHEPGTRAAQTVVEAIATMVTCCTDEAVICAIDSALHLRLTTQLELARVLSRRGRRLLARADARAESGVETIFRLRALAAGFRFRTQVALPGRLRVDFLLGDRLVVEVDGRAHHAGPTAFAADRDRDAWLAAMGYRTVHFSYEQVVHRWHEVESVLRLMLRRGEHLAA